MNDTVLTIEAMRNIAAFFFCTSVAWAVLSLVFPDYDGGY